MNTILKTGTATAVLLLALLTGACGTDGAAEHSPKVVPARPAAALTARASTPALSHPRSCGLSPDAIERWIRDGKRLPCVAAANRAIRNYGDDHRRPVR